MARTVSPARIIPVWLFCLMTLASPALSRAAAPPAKPRLDRHGDPLPLHALARLGTVRFHDRRPEHALVFSRDGKTLFAANHEGVLSWQFPQGKQAGWLPITPHPEFPSNVLLFRSRDGLCVVGNEKDGLIVRDAVSGKLLRKLPKDSVVPEALSPDGKLAAKRHGRESISLWDFTTGKTLHDSLGEGQIYVSVLAFTPDGKNLVSGETGRGGALIRFWDVQTGKPLRTVAAGPLAYPQAIAFTPDGKTMAVAVCMLKRLRRPTSDRDYSLTLYDVASGKMLKQLDDFGRWGEAMTFSPDGKTLAVGRHGPIELYDVATGKTLTPQGHKRLLLDVAFRPSRKEIVTTGDDEVVRVWSTAGEPVASTSLQDRRAVWLSLSADGSRAAWSPEFEAQVQARDLLAGKNLVPVALEKQALRGLRLCPRGNVLAMHLRPADKADDASDDVLRLWDLSRKAPIRLPGAPDRSLPVALSPGGRLLVFGDDKHLTIREVGTHPRRLRLTHDAAIMSRAVLSADERTLVTYHHDGTLQLWEVNSGKRRGPAMKHPDKDRVAAGPVALSPDGTLLASGGAGVDPHVDAWNEGANSDGTIRIWDVVTSKEVFRFRGHRGAVTALAFSPDGKTLLSGGSDHTALVWDVTAVVRSRRPVPSAERLRACWEDLASDDASKAHAAVWDLSAAPRVTVNLLWGRLAPVPEFSRERLKRWIADLDSDDLDVREEASKALAQAGEQAVPALREALRSPSLEVRRRARAVIEQFEKTPVPRELVRAMRAVEALERISTDEARRLLLRLAGGAPEARLTQDADAALRRLARR